MSRRPSRVWISFNASWPTRFRHARSTFLTLLIVSQPTATLQRKGRFTATRCVSVMISVELVIQSIQTMIPLSSVTYCDDF